MSPFPLSRLLLEEFTYPINEDDVHGDVVPVFEEDKGNIRTAYLTRHPDAFWLDFYAY